MQNSKVDEKKICFVTCVNDDRAMEEALYYISRLEIPDGYEVETLQIKDAKSMTSGYNEAISMTNAKYKVYMHQDVLIINRHFIIDLLDIYKNPEIGMIGMVGAPEMPESGIMWNASRVGGLYSHNHYETITAHFDEMEDAYYFDVEAVDGFLISTQYDLPWREDVFKGWDFYDVSQSYEFRKHGYKVAVPHQNPPWCLHDDGFLNLKNYYKTRKLFKATYMLKEGE